MSNQIIFKRKAWRRVNGRWVPYPTARKTYVDTVGSSDEARSICKEHNDNRTSQGDAFYEFTTESNY